MFKPLDSNHPVAQQLAKEQEVSQLARRLMDEHGLEDWTFSISKDIRTLGWCWYQRKQIQFSNNFLNNPDEEIEDVIRHEIAHALAYLRYGDAGKGHNHLWRLVCREVGARPQRLNYTAVGTAKPKYKIECPSCGRTWMRFRMRKRNFGSWCPDCRVEVKIYRISYKSKEGINGSL